MSPRREDGAVAIVTALILIVLVLVAAFLVDLGGTRADARTDQLLADNAILAAAHTDGDVRQQCRAAIDFYAANLDVVAPNPSPHPCDDLLDCPPQSTPITTDPIVVGDFTMHVTYPVPQTDDAMAVQNYNAVRDGQLCDRIKISVARTRDYSFAAAGGAGSSGRSFNDAVAVRVPGPGPEEFGSLIVLETEACNALRANGSGEVQVLQGSPYVDDDGVTRIPEGIISVDSTADGGSGSNDCNSGTRYAIVAPSSGCLAAADHIYSWGLFIDPIDPHVYDPSSVEPPPGACDPAGPGGINGGMSPEPEGGVVIGRRGLDWTYNCLTTYPDASMAGNQRYPVADHKGAGGRHGSCPDVATTPPYVDLLHGALQSGDLETNHDFYRVGPGVCPDVEFDGTTLTLSDGTVATPAEPRIWMDCNVNNGLSFDAVDLEYVVFDDSVDKPDLLRVHGPTDAGAVVYFRGGGVEASGAGTVVDLIHTFSYIDARSGATAVEVTGGDLTWRAPVSDPIRAECDNFDVAYFGPGADLPPAGCFAPLALWSNNSDDHTLAGGANITVEGSFFTPNAFQFIGGNGMLDFTDSQFFALFLRTTGTGNIELVPNPQTNVPFPPPPPGLIR